MLPHVWVVDALDPVADAHNKLSLLPHAVDHLQLLGSASLLSLELEHFLLHFLEGWDISIDGILDLRHIV